MTLMDPQGNSEGPLNKVRLHKANRDLSAMAVEAEPVKWHDLSHLKEPERSKAEKLLRRYDHLFAWDGKVRPSAIPIMHRIDTIPGAPPRWLRNRRFNPYKLEIMKDLVADLVADGHLTKSTSKYVAQPVLAYKHDDAGNITGHRLTVDYRQLNKDTLPASHPPPVPESITDQLHGYDLFCKIDCAKGFHQILTDPETRHKTAFRVGNDVYEWLTMPMGLSNSPATYQQAMEMVLEPIMDTGAHLFYDDILTKGKGFDNTLAHLEIVLQRCDMFRVTLHPGKSIFFKPNIPFLGNTITSEGIRPSGPKLDKVRNYPVPANRKQLRAFLGFANFLRRFVTNYAEMAAPLTRLQSTKVRYTWDEEADRSFESIKRALLSSPVVAYPDYTQPFRIYADASNLAIGAVITQMQDGLERIIDTASRVLSPSEQNYSVTERECLAIFYAVDEKFNHFIWGSPHPVEVITDHSALQWLSTIRNPSQRLWRWILALQNFRIKISHRPGEQQLADAFSRIGEAEETIEPPALNLVINRIEVDEIEAINPADLLALQLADTDYAEVFAAKAHDPTSKPEQLHGQLSEKGRILLRNWASMARCEATGVWYVLRDGAHRMVIAPSSLIDRLFHLAHSSPRAGHLGVRRTIARIQESFYWPKMGADIANLVRQCQPCGCRKKMNLARMPLKPISANRPFEVMGADLAGPLPVKSKRGHRYILVLVDKFSKYIAAYPLKHASTEEVVAAFNSFIADFDAPSRLITDRGSCFSSKVFRGWCLARGISKKRTTSYYPKGDGMTERAVQTVKNMLFCVCPDLGQDWDRALPLIVEAYRKSSNDCLAGLTPFQIVRGIPPVQQPTLLLGHLADDAVLDDNATPEEHGLFIASEIERITGIASAAIHKAQQAMKAYHDRHVPRHTKFYVGDQVRKLLPPQDQVNTRFSNQIFVILQETDVDVYMVKPVDEEEPVDTVNGASLKLYARANQAALLAMARSATLSSSLSTSINDDRSSTDPDHDETSETSSLDSTTSAAATNSTGNSEATILPNKRNRKQATFIDYAHHIRVAAWVRDLSEGLGQGSVKGNFGQAIPPKSIGCGELAPREGPTVGGVQQLRSPYRS